MMTVIVSTFIRLNLLAPGSLQNTAGILCTLFRMRKKKCFNFILTCNNSDKSCVAKHFAAISTNIAAATAFGLDARN